MEIERTRGDQRVCAAVLAERCGVRQHPQLGVGCSRDPMAGSPPLISRYIMAASRALLIGFLILAASCARSSESTDSAPRSATDRNVISRDELQDPVIVGMDALRAIRYLRPTFFRGTGPQSFVNPAAGLVQFSMDYGPVQPLSNLSSLPALSLQTIYEVRYLDPNEAQNRFGINANGGPVIVVVSNKQ
jgi:hypothetical protein